jgi:hypothetical protein
MSTIAEKLTTVAENVPKVYEAGQKSEYDRFWDNYQQNGDLGDYSSAFRGNGWTDETFKPKYDIKITDSGGTDTFYSSKLSNIKQSLIECGVNLDTSECKNVTNMFTLAKTVELPVIDLRKATSTSSCFNAIYLTTIDEILVSETTVFTAQTFQRARSLINVKFTGTIACSITLSVPPLSVESAKSVISALKNYAGTAKEFTQKLTLSSTAWMALNEAEAPPSCDMWEEYVYSLGWQYG